MVAEVKAEEALAGNVTTASNDELLNKSTHQNIFTKLSPDSQLRPPFPSKAAYSKAA